MIDRPISQSEYDIQLSCYDGKGDYAFTYATRSRNITVTEEQIYYRKQSPSQTAETAKKQIASQEMWGGPPQNFMPSHIPKVQAYIYPKPLTEDRSISLKRIEFTTKVTPDRGCIPFSPSWSIDPNDPTTEREGLWNEDGYAKIKVKVTFCNQVEVDKP